MAPSTFELLCSVQVELQNVCGKLFPGIGAIKVALLNEAMSLGR